MASHLFKLFTQKKKVRKGPSESNQSMIDFIAEDVSANDSFRSHQPHWDSSLSDLDHLNRRLTEASPTSANFPITHKPRANISSVFNTPKKVYLI